MKLFQNIQLDLSILGIDSNQTIRSRRKLVVTCLIYGLTMTSSVLFLGLKATTFNEFTNNIYTTSFSGAGCIEFAIIAIKRTKVFDLIDDFKIFIEKSE